ncbi:DUF1080 domain-containing protein [Flavimarina sp. Hel_I_48]|uniref:3-keto-disaccharide hydrolase n=1 Tax=Flavimarina sp. Hel_I_48 TaxID=1392488 RepID=UPI0004DF6086|nr:DUF1080 domain-containing protein [Flavimarina sp. Hel_I_48]
MKYTLTACALAAITLLSCKENKTNEENTPMEETTAMDQDVNANEQEEWTVLFDGKNMDGWHAYNGDKPTQWAIVDDALVLTPAENRSGSENLITDKEYTDFELSLDWKISEGGNSGVLYAVEEDKKYNEPYATGPEIQVLDNERHPDAKAGTTHQAGALYDMIPPSENVAKPAGEWNTMTIMINHKENMGKVTLNGTEVVDFPVEGDQWKEMISKSKFADWENFGQAKTGKIALQDHGNSVSYRNIKIKEL